MRDNLKAALAYAEHGYAVFPLHSPDANGCDCHRKDCASPAKHPRNTNGLTGATTDTAQVEAWWRMWPHANIGVATGPVSGLVVLDIDPRDGGDAEIRELTVQHGLLPYGLNYETGGGGEHYWFRHPGHKVTSRKLAGQRGIDVKGDGGYVIVPPSAHITGAAYAFFDGIDVATAVPALPGWLLAMLAEKPELPESVVSASLMTIPLGERNAALTREGGALRRRGHSQARIFKFLLDLNDELCQPPLEMREVAQIAASVARYDPTPEVPVIVDLDERRKEKAGYTPSPFTARELQSMELPDVRWAVTGLLPEGLAVLAGRQKLGKSWWTFNLGIAVAEGGIVFNELAVEEGEALLLALEDNRRRIKSRMQMMVGSTAWPERLFIETKWPRQGQGGVEALDAWLGQHPLCRLVVVDTLAKFRPQGAPGGKRGDVYAEDYAAMEGLQELAGRHGVAIVLVTHYNKAFHEDWTNAITGSTGISGAADTLIGLERKRGRDGQKETVLHLTGRDVEEQDYAMAFDAELGRWSMVGEAEAARVSRETADLINAMQRIGHPASPDEVAAVLGLTRPAAYKRLYKASLDGYIKTLSPGKLYGLPNDAAAMVNLEGTPGGCVGFAGFQGLEADPHPPNPVNPETPETLTPSTLRNQIRSRSKNGADARPTVDSAWNHTPSGPTGVAGVNRCAKCGSDEHMTLRVGGVYRCSVCEPHVRLASEEAAT